MRERFVARSCQRLATESDRIMGCHLTEFQALDQVEVVCTVEDLTPMDLGSALALRAWFSALHSCGRNGRAPRITITLEHG